MESNIDKICTIIVIICAIINIALGIIFNNVSLISYCIGWGLVILQSGILLTKK